MDPVSAIAVGSMAMTAAGAAVNAFGQYEGGQAQAAYYNYKAGVAQVNQKIAQQNADYARYAGEVQAQGAGMKTRADVGAATAIKGASGLDVRTGSAARTIQSISDIGHENIAIIRSNAAKKAYGYEVQAMQEGAEAQLDVFGGKQAKVAGTIGAIGSLLGGAGSVSSKWLQGQQSGVFGSSSSKPSMYTSDLPD